MPPKLTERDLQIIIGGVEARLHEAYPLPDDDDSFLLPLEGTESWRDVLARVERAWRSMKDEEE